MDIHSGSNIMEEIERMEAEEIIERECAEPSPYADLDPATRRAFEDRVRQQAADSDPKTGIPFNRHRRRRAAVLGRRG